MAEDYSDRGLQVLAVNVAGDSREDIDRFASQHDLEQRFVLNGRRLARHYGIRGTPTTIFLDASGREVARQVGSRPLGDMRRQVEKILPR